MENAEKKVSVCASVTISFSRERTANEKGKKEQRPVALNAPTEEIR